jgi:hypothetical protein
MPKSFATCQPSHDGPRSPCRRSLRSAAVAAALAGVAALCAAPARAFAPDLQGDFLPTYTGPQGGDLDVLFAYGLWDPARDVFSFGGVMSAPIGTTAGALYVWGIDRGAGTERFVGASPSIGAGVYFDSVVVLDPTHSVYTVNLFNGTSIALDAAAVEVRGNTIVVDVPAADLPTMGRDFAQYGWNLWPRLGAGNAAVSDFAPDAATPRVVTVSAVPEPASFALMLAGGALVAGARLRRR